MNHEIPDDFYGLADEAYSASSGQIITRELFGNKRMEILQYTNN
jgi:hypothetical protein